MELHCIGLHRCASHIPDSHGRQCRSRAAVVVMFPRLAVSGCVTLSRCEALHSSALDGMQQFRLLLLLYPGKIYPDFTPRSRSSLGATSYPVQARVIHRAPHAACATTLYQLLLFLFLLLFVVVCYCCCCEAKRRLLVLMLVVLYSARRIKPANENLPGRPTSTLKYLKKTQSS